MDETLKDTLVLPSWSNTSEKMLNTLSKFRFMGNGHLKPTDNQNTQNEGEISTVTMKNVHSHSKNRYMHNSSSQMLIEENELADSK